MGKVANQAPSAGCWVDCRCSIKRFLQGDIGIMEMSELFLNLSDQDKQEYLGKITILGVDPYLVAEEECSTDLEHFPKIMYPDIVMYLLHTKSKYTMEEMKAYKSLEAYNQAACGWVRKLCVKNFGNRCLLLGKVMHSQRLQEKPVSLWIIAQSSGTVETAHCDCTAGLSGVCCHVAAVLFVVDQNLRDLEEVTRTGRKAYWMPPSNKPTAPKRVVEIDFRTAKKQLCSDDVSKPSTSKENIPAMSQEERKSFLSKMFDVSQLSVTHMVTQPFAENIKQEFIERQKYYIMALFKEEYLNKTLNELLNIGSTVEFNYDIEDCKRIERETKEQSKVKSWFMYRAGRVTASNFKRCCRSNVENPSLSLIKSICYPTTYKFKSKSLEYGCTHEKEAAKQFTKLMKQSHTNFSFEKLGFVINPNYFYFGASPDGYIECDCCGTSIAEIKCPYCARNSGVADQLENKEFYLQLKDNKIILKEDHTYYYQIQMQLGLTRQEKCFLIVWSPKTMVYTEIKFDETFWEREKEKPKSFFHKVLLPEALGKYFTKEKHQSEAEGLLNIDEGETEEVIHAEEVDWFTTLNWDFCDENASVEEERPAEQTGSSETSSSKILYCICQPEDDKKTPMISCDRPNCLIQWYHLKCVGLQDVPQGHWECSHCMQK